MPNPEIRLAALDICAAIGQRVSYRRGSTQVTSTARDAWTGGHGVCQDYTHLAIGALRSIGIPARYVSGYLHPRSTADIGEAVAGQSHALLEWWDGEWRSWDPTNHKPAGDFHVTVARGRDYRDVPPLKGVLSGGGGSALTVSGANVATTVSAGIVERQADETLEAALKRADDALYRAKDAGRNQVAVG